MNPINPISIIKADHKKIVDLFNEYQSAELSKKKNLANKICENLVVHMEMEEETFYPEVEDISDEAEILITDAQEEHDNARSHIIDIIKATTEEEIDDHVTILKEVILAHVQKEENKILSLAEINLKNNFVEIAAKMDAFKAKNKGEILIEKLKEKFE